MAPQAVNVLLLFGALSSLALVTSLTLEEVAEPCRGNFITRDYNNWDIKLPLNTTWYMPLGSKYHALHVSLNLYKSRGFSSITEAQLENSCIAGHRVSSPIHYNTTGYDGGHILVDVAPTSVPNVLRMTFPFPDVFSGGSYNSIALSDNESYNVHEICFGNSLRSFAVVSRKPKLDENTLDVIRAHMKSLGFKEENFIYLNYDSCVERDGVPFSSMESLPQTLETEVTQSLSNGIFDTNLIYSRYVVG